MVKPLQVKQEATHRIGAVSRLSGVPVPTLRVWEVRYQTFSPQKTDGKQRLYTDEDVLRATLLKRLTEQGHAISRIANLNAGELNDLLQRQPATQENAVQQFSKKRPSIALVGLPLAGRLESPRFPLSSLSNAISITDIFADLAEALDAPFKQPPDILLVRVNSLNALVQVDIHNLVKKHNIFQVIVIYNFGQAGIVDSMRRAGTLVRREPLSDSELADLINSVLLVDPLKSPDNTEVSAMIPPRKYSDEVLTRVAGISTNVLCECPRHVAEIITLLASFEQYSQECLNNTVEDAHLHALLSSVSGSARAMFEQALEMLAKHEGINLTTLDKAH